MTRRFGPWGTRGIISPGLEKDFRTETISGRQGAGGRRQSSLQQKHHLKQKKGLRGVKTRREGVSRRSRVPGLLGSWILPGLLKIN